jgi:hypothetical protein
MQHVYPGEQAHVNRSAAHTIERSKDTEEGGTVREPFTPTVQRVTARSKHTHTHTVTLDTLRVCGE